MQGRGKRVTIGTIKTYVSGWKKIRPCGLAKTCFIFSTFLHSVIRFAFALIYHDPRRSAFQVDRVSRFFLRLRISSVNSTPTSYKLLQQYRLSLSRFSRRMQSLHQEDFACNCVCHLSQVNGRCSYEWYLCTYALQCLQMA